MRLTVVRGPSPAGPFDLHEGTNHAGRDPSCEVCLPSKRVSRKHAVFEVKDGQVEVRDLGSHNGILSGAGSRVDSLVLQSGGRVQIGDYLLKVEGTDEELDLEEDDLILDEETAESAAAPPPPPPPTRSPTLAPPPAPALPTPAVVPPPPQLPFAPAGGFGGFGKRPLDPARSFILEPEPPPPPPPPPVQLPPSPAPVAPIAAKPAPAPFVPAPAPFVPAPPTSAPAPLASVPLAPRPELPPPPPPEARPIERAPASGVPWLLQATFLLFCAISLLVCSPVGGIVDLIWSGRGAVEEVSVLRGVALTESLANRNAQPLADQRGIALETSFLLERDGVRGALIADTRGTVMAPAEKLRTSISSQPAYAEASRTGEIATAGVGDLTQIAVPIRAQVGGAGPKQLVGYALVDYDPGAVGDSIASPIVAVIQAFVVLGLVVALLVAGAWWLMLRPLAQLREETELALLGDTHTVATPVRLAQLEQLVHSINRLAARARANNRR